MILERSEIVCSKISKAYDPKFAYESMGVFLHRKVQFDTYNMFYRERACFIRIK